MPPIIAANKPVQQWQERLGMFLDLPPKAIGHIGGGKMHRTGCVDVAVIQSLYRQDVGRWQYRYIDWIRDLGYLQEPGVETKAARDIATFLTQPPRPASGTARPAR